MWRSERAACAETLGALQLGFVARRDPGSDGDAPDGVADPPPPTDVVEELLRVQYMAFVRLLDVYQRSFGGRHPATVPKEVAAFASASIGLIWSEWNNPRLTDASVERKWRRGRAALEAQLAGTETDADRQTVCERIVLGAALHRFERSPVLGRVPVPEDLLEQLEMTHRIQTMWAKLFFSGFRQALAEDPRLGEAWEAFWMPDRRSPAEAQTPKTS